MVQWQRKFFPQCALWFCFRAASDLPKESRRCEISIFRDIWEKWIIYDRDNSQLSGAYIISLIIDDNDVIWIGTYDGLFRIENDSMTVFNSSNSEMPHSQVNCIAIDKYGNKWLGSTFGGLMAYREGGVILNKEDNEKSIQMNVQCYPNPFSNSTTIKYYLDKPANVKLKIYNALGQETALIKDEFQSEGEHKARFKAGDLPTDMYYYKLIINNNIQSGRIILIK